MKQMTKFIIVIFLFCITSFCVSAQVKLPSIISDSMVLQQRSNTPIWGWASRGEKISVKGSWMNSVPVSTSANSDGKWMIKIKTPKAGGPYTVTIQGKNTIVLHGVMIGEVWICSGQSNMEMPVHGWEDGPILNSAEEIKNAQHSNVRLFTVKRNIALTPKKDCTGSWSSCTPETVAGFSATAYFFGKQLYQKLKVPIGLVHTSWGGTPAEAWTSNSALKSLNDFDSALNKLDSIKPHVKELLANDERKLNAWNKAMKNINNEYANENFDDAGWQTMTLPTQWEAAGYPDLDGIVWFRKEINIPEAWAGKKLKVELGPIDDMDITWFNGKEVGNMQGDGYWATNRSYNIPGELVKAGKAVIAIRVTDTGGDGGLWGEKKQLKIYPADATAKDTLSISGEWRYKIDVVKEQPSAFFNANNPSLLFNGMIAPLIPFAIRGAIWYQGESNVGRAAQYQKLFPAMINDWRSRWHEGNFPFYFVQIAPFKYWGSGTDAAALRDAQRKTLDMPNTGMAVTLDIGDLKNIHPANKPEAGRRLALWALAKTYGEKNIVYSGPLFKSIQFINNTAIVSFDNTEGGLILNDTSDNEFEIAGEDGNFISAEAVVNNSNILVSSDKVQHPVAVSYAWSDTAAAVLFNKAGLPASSFTTHNFSSTQQKNILPDWALGGFVRAKVNPIITPRSESTFNCPMQKKMIAWESNDTFNPAAVVKNDSIIVLYRAEDKSGVGIGERTSRIGYAATADGTTMNRRDEPVLYPAEDNAKEFEWTGGCEDPRVAVTEDGIYVMLYTEWNKKVPRLAAATSKDLINWTKHGPAFKNAYNGRFADMVTKSASIITKLENDKLVIAKIDGKYWMYWGEHFVNAATSTDLINWQPMLDDKGKLKQLITTRTGYFDSDLTECGPPAVMTDKGIVLLYNGKNAGDERRDKRFTANTYCAGQVLFDKNDPTKPIARLDVPFLHPMESFEKSGQYIAGTVFIEGLVYYKKKWFLYYGCADSRVAVAVYDPSARAAPDPLPEK